MQTFFFRTFRLFRLFIFSLFIGFTSFTGFISAASGQASWENEIIGLIENNRFSEAADRLNSLNNLSGPEQTQKDWYFELMRRIRIEFPYDESEIKEQLAEAGFSNESDQLRQWEEKKYLEMREIDGKRCYFRMAVPNLCRLDQELWNNRRITDMEKARKEQRQQTAATIIKVSQGNGDLVLPKTGVFTYIVTVPANKVPAGETIRFWAPFPRESSPRQQEVKLISTDPEECQIAPASDLQRCVYLEKTAVQDQPTVFKIVFQTTSYAQYFSQDYLLENVKPYPENSEIVKAYTVERFPHIIKSDVVKNWTKAIVGDETNPVKKVSLIFDAMKKRYPWASSNEYSTMFCIPHYVLKNGHGDCGMFSLLLISALRCEGIPAKWQSGWISSENGRCDLHDWLEVYYEGIGWVPIDISYGFIPSDDPAVYNFYKSGHDPYRLIINDEISCPFTPNKKFFRSEPVDFQRGEIEWDGGNLYFPEWEYRMTVEFLN